VTDTAFPAYKQSRRLQFSLGGGYRPGVWSLEAEAVCRHFCPFWLQKRLKFENSHYLPPDSRPVCFMTGGTSDPFRGLSFPSPCLTPPLASYKRLNASQNDIETNTNLIIIKLCWHVHIVSSTIVRVFNIITIWS